MSKSQISGDFFKAIIDSAKPSINISIPYEKVPRYTMVELYHGTTLPWYNLPWCNYATV